MILQSWKQAKNIQVNDQIELSIVPHTILLCNFISQNLFRILGGEGHVSESTEVSMKTLRKFWMCQ